MRRLLCIALLASCGGSSAYRDINGAPYDLSHRCAEGAPNLGQVGNGGAVHECPNLFQVKCRQPDGSVVVYKIAGIDPLTEEHGLPRPAAPPSDAAVMCARIAQH